MGLDIVELILRVEEEFAIEIPDTDAGRLSTLGALCDFIEGRIARTCFSSSGHAYCPTSRAFYAVRRELMQLGIERHRVTPQTSLEALWPRSQRRRNWDALGKSLHFELPSLCRSPEWVFIGLLPLGLFPIWLLLFPVTAVAAFAFTLVLWWLGFYFTQPFAIHAPDEMRSVADLARRLSPRFCNLEDSHISTLWPLVRALIADEVSLSLEQVTRDADFVRDLGLD